MSSFAVSVMRLVHHKWPRDTALILLPLAESPSRLGTENLLCLRCVDEMHKPISLSGACASKCWPPQLSPGREQDGIILAQALNGS